MPLSEAQQAELARISEADYRAVCAALGSSVSARELASIRSPYADSSFVSCLALKWRRSLRSDRLRKPDPKRLARLRVWSRKRYERQRAEMGLPAPAPYRPRPRRDD